MVTRRLNIVIAISLVLASAILVIAVWVLAQMRDDVLRRAQDFVFNVSLQIERDVSRNPEIYDLSLRAAIDGLTQSGVLDLNSALRQVVLFDSSVSAKDMGSVLVADEAGNIRFDSRVSPPRRNNLADRDYFKVLRDSPDVGLYISRPFSTKRPPSHMLTRAQQAQDSQGLRIRDHPPSAHAFRHACQAQ